MIRRAIITFGLVFLNWVIVTDVSAAQGLMEKFQVGRPVSHHIVLLDTSGSMRPYFSQVLEAVHMLLQALPPDDVLTVYRFDDFPVRLCHDQVGKIPLSACLPREINLDPKSRTEIGETFEKALDEIEASRGSVAILYFLTDGREEPRRGSRYERNHDESWRALVRRGQEITLQREVWGYGLGIQRYTDVNLLARILPEGRVEVISMQSPSELRGLIEGLRERVRKNWLRSAVKRELETGSRQCEVVAQRSHGKGCGN